MEIKNYYGVLGIDKSAQIGGIKVAFRNLSLKWHPDRNPPQRKRTAHERFIEISEAYEVLIDPAKRRQYDLLHERCSEKAAIYEPPQSKKHELAGSFGRFVKLVAAFFAIWYIAMIPVGVIAMVFTFFLAIIWLPLAETIFTGFILFALLFPGLFILRSAVRVARSG